MTIKDDFNGAEYGLPVVEVEDLTNIIITAETGITVVIILSASSIDYESADIEIVDVRYSQDGGTWSSEGETGIPGIEYTLYKNVRNVIRNNPEGIVAVTIDVPHYEYKTLDKKRRQIEFNLHLETEGGTFTTNLEELITQNGCKIGYEIRYTVPDNLYDRDMMDEIERNIDYFTTEEYDEDDFENPARMQYIVSRSTMDDRSAGDREVDRESDWDSYENNPNYTEYRMDQVTCEGCCSAFDNDKIIKTSFPSGRDIIPAGFYNNNGEMIEYADYYFPDRQTVVFVFDEPVKEIGYHTFCFSGHYDCYDDENLPECDSSENTAYIYESGCGELIDGASVVTHDGKLDGTDWETDGDNKYIVFPGRQLERVFNFADRIQSVTLNKYVDTIGNQAFKYLTSLTSITFGNNSSLSTIGMFAFEHTDSLRNITIPSTVSWIGEGAFKNSGIQSVNIPAQLDRVECGVFRNCTSLSSVTFDDNCVLTKIGTTAFYGCSSLESITLPESLVRIEKSAFKNCSSLSSVTFNAGLRYIGKNAFSGTSIEVIDLSGCNTSNGDWFTLQKDALKNLATLKKIILPDYCILDERSLAFGKYIRPDDGIELEIGKHTIMDTDCFCCNLPVKKLTLRYESEGDVVSSINFKYINTDHLPLYITQYVWDNIKQEPSSVGFFRTLYYLFIYGKHDGVFVKNEDGTYTEKTW